MIYIKLKIPFSISGLMVFFIFACSSVGGEGGYGIVCPFLANYFKIEQMYSEGRKFVQWKFCQTIERVAGFEFKHC